MLRQEAINLLKELEEVIQSQEFDSYTLLEYLDESIGLLERADEIENK